MEEKINGEIINNIPEEIIEEILHKLPVKPLLRFKCVSKSWRSLISGKTFIENHLKKSIANGDRNKLLFSFTNRTTKLMCRCSCSLRDEPIITPDFNFDGHSIPGGVTSSCRMVGSCNGLILVDTSDALFIWNPSTRRVIKEFKPPFFDDGLTFLGLEYGLGYDESTGDYKVACTHNCKTQMYSCNTDSWKEIQTRSDKGFWEAYGSAKFVNGRFHWLVGGLTIVSLRLSDEKFENELIIPGPTQYPSILSFGDIEGYLSLCCQDIGNVNVWVMMEYGVTESWTKVWTLSDPEILTSKGPAYPLCLKKNGDITVAFESGDIVVYRGEQELRKSHVHMDNPLIYFVVYVESLV